MYIHNVLAQTIMPSMATENYSTAGGFSIHLVSFTTGCFLSINNKVLSQRMNSYLIYANKRNVHSTFT